MQPGVRGFNLAEAILIILLQSWPCIEKLFVWLHGDSTNNFRSRSGTFDLSATDSFISTNLTYLPVSSYTLQTKSESL